MSIRPFFIAILFLNACTPDEIFIPKSGGDTTILSEGPDAFTFPLANLDKEGLQLHLEADAAFGQTFVTAPSTQAGGLGPLFNQNSCESCHVRNGRSSAPAHENDLSSGLLLRISNGIDVNGFPISVPGFGGQLQTKGIFGTTPEGKLSKSEEKLLIKYLTGEEITLSKPIYHISVPYQNLPVNLLMSPRNAQPVFGLGLLEAIKEEDLRKKEDANDSNGDGISGKLNEVWDISRQAWAAGRFGWKAEQPTARQQSAGAASNDMGLTNPLFPSEQCEGQINCTAGLQTQNDIDDRTLDLFTFYFQTLAVPARRNINDQSVREGEKLFTNLQCASCHHPTYTTGYHDIKALAGQTIYPYTDLLLHDMGEGLSDHRPVFKADGNEWRTPPLWGIGLTKVVNPKAGFLHDGRATTLEEAILWHDGEAKKSKDQFMALSKDERILLLKFLESL